MRTLLLGAFIGAMASGLVLVPTVGFATNKVETQTITVPADPDAGDSAAPVIPPDSNTSQSATEIPADLPPVEYDLAKLPPAVATLREKIIEAAATGDPEKLRPVIEAAGSPQFGPDENSDPIAYLKLQSGDGEGREMLAILTEVLDAGFVHVDVGTPDEMYIWPYFARYPIDKLTPPQLVQLFKLVYAGDYEDMVPDGVYTYFRVGISPDGKWKYFTDQN